MKILRPEVQKSIVSTNCTLYDMFDNVFKTLFNITDTEYDFIAGLANDEELQIFITSIGQIGEPSTFTQRRLAIELRNQFLIKFNAQS
jgi:hypothetical protein